jgi:hypothetical protein
MLAEGLATRKWVVRWLVVRDSGVVCCGSGKMGEVDIRAFHDTSVQARAIS